MILRAPAWSYGALAASLGFALHGGARWNEKLVQSPVHGQILAAQASSDDGPDVPSSGRVYQRIRKTADGRAAEYGFVNFRQDRVSFTYRIPEPEFKRYNAQYGYRAEDIAALQRKRDQAVQASYRAIVAKHGDQAQVDAAAAAVERQYKKDLVDYLESRGFMLDAGNTTRIDMPRVVKTNGPLLKPVARIFDQIATQRGYQSMDIIGTVLSFAQTAVKYKEPEDVYKGKHTGGILPPVTTVVLGWGDCDTKTGMIASILSNWAQMRMIGISVPGHYLMAVLQIADQGDMYVEYQGLQYVLLEPAGPAWLPPGQVAETTSAELNGSDGYKIYPFF